MQPVGQHGHGQLLQVVGDDVVASLQGRVGTRRAHEVQGRTR